MASNGYVRRDCSGCIFYESDREYGEFCTLKADGLESDSIRWVSANDCDRYPDIKEKYYEKCEHRVREKDIKNAIRKTFGFEEYKYSY